MNTVPKQTLILITGHTYPDVIARRGDFHDWILARSGLRQGNAFCIDVRRGEALPTYKNLSGLIITGSHDMVSDHHTWSENTACWLEGAVREGIPILGICYGHQLLAYALGGEVKDNPRGREYGTTLIQASEAASGDALFHNLPSRFNAHVGHKQTVTRLPEGAVPLAHSAMDDTQAVRFDAHAWGIQFHPEFDAWAAREYILRNQEVLSAEGQDPDRLLESVAETPHSESILRHFVKLIYDDIGQ